MISAEVFQSADSPCAMQPLAAAAARSPADLRKMQGAAAVRIVQRLAAQSVEPAAASPENWAALAPAVRHLATGLTVMTRAFAAPLERAFARPVEQVEAG